MKRSHLASSRQNEIDLINRIHTERHTKTEMSLHVLIIYNGVKRGKTRNLAPLQLKTNTRKKNAMMQISERKTKASSFVRSRIITMQ